MAHFTDPGFVRNRYTVFTQSTGFQGWTFTQYLRFVTSVYGVQIDGAACDAMIDRFNFSQFADKRISTLSTGNR